MSNKLTAVKIRKLHDADEQYYAKHGYDFSPLQAHRKLLLDKLEAAEKWNETMTSELQDQMRWNREAEATIAALEGEKVNDVTGREWVKMMKTNDALKATITALETTMEKIGALPESWRSLIGVSVSTKEIDKAVDTVFEDLSFELQALLKQEQE